MLSPIKIVGGRFAGWGRPVSLALMVLATLAMLVLWNSQAFNLLAVDSGSMAPFILRGDAVVTHQINPLDIRKGDIISYRSPEDSSLIITHRVLVADPQTGQVITKGDANAGLDPLFNGAAVLGRVRYVVPGGGHVLHLLQSWPGLIFLIYLPAMVLLFSELRRLAAYYLRPTYVLHQRRY